MGHPSAGRGRLCTGREPPTDRICPDLLPWTNGATASQMSKGHGPEHDRMRDLVVDSATLARMDRGAGLRALDQRDASELSNLASRSARYDAETSANWEADGWSQRRYR